MILTFCQLNSEFERSLKMKMYLLSWTFGRFDKPANRKNLVYKPDISCLSKVHVLKAVFPNKFLKSFCNFSALAVQYFDCNLKILYGTTCLNTLTKKIRS